MSKADRCRRKLPGWLQTGARHGSGVSALTGRPVQTAGTTRQHLGHHGGRSGTPGQPCRREDDSTIVVLAQGRTLSRQQSLFNMLHKASIRASTVATRLLLQRRRVAQRAMRHTDRWGQAPRQWELPPGFLQQASGLPLHQSNRAPRRAETRRRA